MTQENIWQLLAKVYENGVFAYCAILFAFYTLLMILARLEIRRNWFMSSFRDKINLAQSKLMPGISVIAPAFNESKTIINNVRSLLTLNYPKFEVIIVNDGSTDDTLQKLIDEFRLIVVDYSYDPVTSSQQVKNFYKSTDKAYKKLLVIDKINGKSKADAFNAGLNAAVFPYFLNTDVDCILDNDALLYLIQPFLSEDKRVLAVGATLRMVNSSDVDAGLITRMRPPRNFWARFQEMEYIRSFVMAKLGWSHINAVPNVSGALGLFDKEIALNVGGYRQRSLGEDMDIIIRMLKYACDHKIDCAIRYLPRTLCWTEGPETLKILKRQRVRWARGLWQIYMSNLYLMFNPKYKRLGLIVYPYNFVFELLAPIIEIVGIIYFILFAVAGAITWKYAMIMLIFVYSFSVFITTISVLYDQLVFRQYKKWSEVIGLTFMAFFEPFIYHPVMLFCSISGYISQVLGRKHSWGNMQRKGFNRDIPANIKTVSNVE